MALLTEQPITTLTEWMAYDSKLSILSALESASVEKKGELAQQEIQTEILEFLLRDSAVGDSEARSLLSRVHVSEPIRRWHAYLTLSLYYVDLASLQASALHREQSRYFEVRSTEAREHAYTTGVGIVDSAVPKAYAPVTALAGEEDPNRLIRARVRFLSLEGVEGSVSEEFLIRPPASGTLSISFPVFPASAATWLLYLAEDSDTFRALRESPHAATEVVMITAGFSLSERRLSSEGQEPGRYVRNSRLTGR
jgi:hypothetical protein